MKEVKYKNYIYQTSDEPIGDGDLIYSIHTGDVDLCVAAFDDGDLVVQFASGMRAVLNKSVFLKLVKQK